MRKCELRNWWWWCLLQMEVELEMELTAALEAALADGDSDEAALPGIGPAANAMLRQRRSDKRDMKRTAKQWLQHQGAPPAAAGSAEADPGARALNGAAVAKVRPGKRPRAAAVAAGGTSSESEGRSSAEEPAEEMMGLLDGHLEGVPGLGAGEPGFRAWNSDDDMPSLPGLPSRPHSSCSALQRRPELAGPPATAAALLGVGLEGTNGGATGAAARAVPTASLASDAAMLLQPSRAQAGSRAGSSKARKRSLMDTGAAEEEAAEVAGILSHQAEAQARGKGRPPKPKAWKCAATQTVYIPKSKAARACEQGAAAAAERAVPNAGGSKRQAAALPSSAAAGLPQLDIEQMMADVAALKAVADAALAEDSDT